MIVGGVEILYGLVMMELIESLFVYLDMLNSDNNY
nr:MAG TPA: hypothetical protein [Caudoviricetes sp.]